MVLYFYFSILDILSRYLGYFYAIIYSTVQISLNCYFVACVYTVTSTATWLKFWISPAPVRGMGHACTLPTETQAPNMTPASVIPVVVHVISFWQECRHRKPRWTGATHNSWMSSTIHSMSPSVPYGASMLKLIGLAVPLTLGSLWSFASSTLKVFGVAVLLFDKLSKACWFTDDDEEWK